MLDEQLILMRASIEQIGICIKAGHPGIHLHNIMVANNWIP